MKEEFIIQGWHILGFIFCFFIGALTILAILKPYIKELKNDFDSEIEKYKRREEYYKKIVNKDQNKTIKTIKM